MKGWVIPIIVLAIYFVSLFGGYVQDDTRVIQGDKSLGTGYGLISAWTEPYYKGDKNSGAYRPVTTFSFAVNGLILGNGAVGYRLVNVALYAFLCWLVFVFLRELIGREGDGLPQLEYKIRNDEQYEMLAFVTALLFALHPIHTEAVNNIVGRSEILSLIFVLLMILVAYKKKWEVSILMFLLAILSKESAILLIAVPMYLLWKDKIKFVEKVGVTIYIGMGIVGYFLIRFLVLGQGMFSNNATIVENPLKFLSYGQRFLGAMVTLTLGVGKLIFPLNLSYDYSFNQIPLPTSMFDLRAVAGGFLVISCGILFFKFMDSCLRRNDKPLEVFLVGLMLFWLPLLVTGNFIFATGTIFGERLWLMPSLGFFILFSSIYRYGFPIRSGMTLLLMVIVVFFGVRTFIRNFDWLSQRSLFLHDAKYATGSVMASSNEAAMMLMDKKFDDARMAMERADKIYSEYPQLMNNWGMYYWLQGDKTKAKEKFELCLKVHPKDGLCTSNMELLTSEKLK